MPQAFTEFCCRSGGSNLNAGTLNGSSTVPGTAASFTYASGSWVSATRVFTVASGNPLTDGVAVGDFASVYPDAETTAVFIGRITARDATTITISGTVKVGTSPVDGTTNTTLKVGGAWAGPSGTNLFPLSLITSALINTAGNSPRINFMNDQTYSMTSGITPVAGDYMNYQGFTSAYGDGGRATIDGGTSGAAYVLLTASNRWSTYADLIFSNNGATGEAALVIGNNSGITWKRCVFAHSRGTGLHFAGGFNNAQFCEAYDCNQSNTANRAGFADASAQGGYTYCISHDNAGSNSNGFYQPIFCYGCIAESNGNKGFNLGSSTCVSCDAYNNTSDGFSTVVHLRLLNCNSVKNGGYGFNIITNAIGEIRNCRYGAGTQANTSGGTPTIPVFLPMEIYDLSALADDVTPWVDPANGDFRINLAAVKGAGYGTFTQTAASYAGTIAYPDIGAAQHQESAAAAAVDEGEIAQVGAYFRHKITFVGY